MRNDDRKVSVIIPAYNAEKSLRVCVDSALGQTLKPYQVLVINDGSTDTTGEIGRSYGDKITCIKQENLGQGAARNAGLEKAGGQFIAFLDADDYWKPEFLERCVDFLSSHEEAVAALTGWEKILDAERKVIVPPIMNAPLQRPAEPIVLEDFFRFWAEQDHVQTGAIMIRSGVIRQAGLQRADLRVSQDLEYWAYIATFGKWGFIPEILYVNNSRMNARADWVNRYRQRRQLCPTVEAWERRIVPRLKDDENSSFQIVRGRLAAAYAHNKILAGDFREALDIVQKYGASMPRNRLTSLMHMGASLGNVGWSFVCLIVRLREFIKAWSLKVLCSLWNGT